MRGVALADEQGVDLYGIEDLTPSMRTVSGQLGLAMAIARRLITPLGALWYDPNYGCDVRRYLSAPVADTGAIAASVAHEAEKDERVERASARVTFVNRSLQISLSLVSAVGPFAFTLSVSAVTAELLLKAPS